MKHIIRFGIAFFSIAILFFFGCKNTTDTAQTQNAFSDVNSWIYSDQEFFGNGQLGHSNIDSIYVVSSTMVNGEKNIFLSNAVTEVLDAAGSVIVKYSYNFTLPYSYKIPSNPGDTISRIDSISVNVDTTTIAGNRITVASNIDTLISVPAGIFHCVCFEIQDETKNAFIASRTFRYICPSVGLVKSETYDFDYSTGIRWLADQYELIRIVK